MSNRPRKWGFGILEMLTALAFLVIVLGVTVSLARYVRGTSAERLTRNLLGRLDDALSNTPPTTEDAVEVDPPAPDATEAEWAAYAVRSNRIVQRLDGSSDIVTDAWGNPIGFLDAKSAAIGMAPHDRPFCFSAGPDGKFLTQDDNLYSYEELSPRPLLPTASGHRE